MSAELIERLRYEAGLERYYDNKQEKVLLQAADLITTQAAEIERLRAALERAEASADIDRSACFDW